MDRSTTYLLTSALRAAHAANAHRPLSREGLGAVASFAWGLPGSELAEEHMALHAASAVRALGRGAHRSWSGRAGLGLTAAAIALLWRSRQEQDDVVGLVDRALVDQLGPGHRDEMARSPLVPRTGRLPRFPTPAARNRYLAAGHVEYGEAGRRTTLDVWARPDLPADAKAPVLLQIHGGAWVLGDKEGQAYPLLTHLAERGWVCVSATYRLSPRATWPDHIVDVKRALAWVKQNVAAHGGDPDWVAITGGSAGGHLSSLAALTPNRAEWQPGFEDVDTSVRAGVPFYGVYDWTDRHGTWDGPDELLATRVVKQSRTDAAAVFEDASPMSHVGPDAPPLLLVHGTNDTLVPVQTARTMVDLLREESRNPVAYVELPGAQHAFDVFSSRRTDAVVSGVERFLNVVRARDGHGSPDLVGVGSTAAG